MRRKLTLLLPVFFMLMSFVSCDLIKENLTVNFDFDVPEIDLVIDGFQKANPDRAPLRVMAQSQDDAIVVFDKVLDINLKKELEAGDHSLDFLKSLVLYEASLYLKEEGEIDLNDYKSLKLYVNDTNEKNLVARVKSVDNANKVIVLDIVTLELLDLLDQDNLHILITAEELPPLIAHFSLALKFRAKVGLK